MTTALFDKCTDLVEKADLDAVAAEVADPANAADLETDSDELTALLVASAAKLRQSDAFPGLVREICRHGGAKTNLLSLLGGFNPAAGLDGARILFPAVVDTVGRVPADRRPKMVCFALSRATSFIRARAAETVAEMGALEGRERIALDADPAHQAVLDYVEDMEPMLAAFKDSEPDLVVNAVTHVLAGGLARLSLHREEGLKEVRFEPRALRVAQRLMAILAELNVDLVADFRLPKNRKRKISGGSDGGSVFNDDDAASFSSKLGFLVGLYLAYGEDVPAEAIPCLYAPAFVWFETLQLVDNQLLSSSNYAFVHKGLLLSSGLLNRLPPRDAIGVDVVDSPVFAAFFRSLVRAVTYCDLGEFRGLGFAIISGIQERLQFDASAKFFSAVMASDCHSGLKGWAITKLKDQALTAARDNVLAATFFGPKFRSLCLDTFKLDRGAETDLLEISDEVMASLSLLWCLGQRDRDAGGIMGMDGILAELKGGYLPELEQGLQMTRGHYRLQLKEMEENPSSKDQACSVIVSGQTLPTLGNDEAKNVIYAALNTTDLMESSLARVKAIL